MSANKTKTEHFLHWAESASDIELFLGGDTVYRSYNPNPARRITNDCVIRAISKLMNLDWLTVHDHIAKESRRKYDTMDANHVWIGWLKQRGYKLYPIQNECPDCYTVQDFCEDHPHGRYLLGTGTHAVAVVDGDWYDSFNSGDLIPTFYMHRRTHNGV